MSATHATAEERIKILEERLDAVTAVVEMIGTVAAHKDRVKDRIAGLEERIKALEQHIKALEQRPP